MCGRGPALYKDNFKKIFLPLVNVVCVVLGVVGRGRGVPGAGAPHHPQPLLQHRDARAHQPRLQ